MASIDTSQVTGLVDALASGTIDIVDLTQPLTESTPVIKLPPPFENTPGLTREEISHYDERGPAWAWYTLTIGEHVGTHLDAPIHWVTGKDGDDVASISPHRLVGAGLRGRQDGRDRGRQRLPAHGGRPRGLGGRERPRPRRRLGAVSHRLAVARPGRGRVPQRRARTAPRPRAPTSRPRAGWPTSATSRASAWRRSASTPAPPAAWTRHFRCTTSCSAPGASASPSWPTSISCRSPARCIVVAPLKLVGGTGSPSRVFALVRDASCRSAAVAEVRSARLTHETPAGTRGCVAGVRTRGATNLLDGARWCPGLDARPVDARAPTGRAADQRHASAEARVTTSKWRWAARAALVHRREDLDRPLAASPSGASASGSSGSSVGKARNMWVARVRIRNASRSRVRDDVAKRRAEGVVAVGQTAQIPGPRDEALGPRARAGDEHGGERVEAEVGQQPRDLIEWSWGETHTPSGTEPKPRKRRRRARRLSSSRRLSGIWCRSSVQPSPPVRGVPEREDAPVALGQQPLAALGHAVVDMAPGAHAAQQAAAHEPGQRHPGRALGEAELAQQQLDEAARPDGRPGARRRPRAG